jgi:hypothetical protein
MLATIAAFVEAIATLLGIGGERVRRHQPRRCRVRIRDARRSGTSAGGNFNPGPGLDQTAVRRWSRVPRR